MTRERLIALRRAILNGIGSVPPVVVSGDELDVLVTRVVHADVENAEGYGYITGRNWAVDRLRRQSVRLRLEAKRLAEEAEAARIDRLREEFLEIGQTLCDNPGRCSTVSEQLMAVYAVCFEGRREEGLYEIFPEVSHDVIYQWKRRGLQRLRPHCSTELWAFLRRKGAWRV